MATHLFNLTVYGETGNNNFTWQPPATAGSMVPGDSISVKATFVGSASGTVIVSGFSATYHTDSTSMTLSNGQTLTRTLKASGYTVPVTLQLTAAKSGFSNTATSYTVLNTNDGTPDAFDLGPAQTYAALSTLYFSEKITLSGINIAVTASVSGTGAYLRKNNSATNYTSVSVVNGDVLQVVLTSASSYNSSRTATLSVGGVSDTFTVTTFTGPGSGIRVPFPFSAAPFSMSDITDFFAGTGFLHTPVRLFSSYVKGGAYVPDVTENAAIAAGVGLKTSQFANAKHSLYILRPAAPQQVSADTSTGAKNLYVEWDMAGALAVDPLFGYGQIKNCLEFRYVMSVTSGSPTLSSNNANPGVYSNANTVVQVLKSSGQMTEGEHAGTVTIYARFKNYPAAEVSMTVGFRLSFYGP